VRRSRQARPDITKLEWIASSHASALIHAGVGTREQLLDRVAADGLDATLAKTSVDPARVRDALARYVLREVTTATHRWPSRVLREVVANWREALLAVLVVLTVLGVVRAAGRPERVVVAVRDLAPFQVIGPADVKEVATEADFGTFASGAEVAGRFPFQVVAAGKPLRRDRVSRIRFPRPSELEGRRIVSLPVAKRSAALAVPTTRVTLVLSPRDGQAAGATAGAILDDVIVLDASAEGDTSLIVVALRKDDLPALARLLGNSELTVVQPVAPLTRKR